jgi:hypothetical protein
MLKLRQGKLTKELGKSPMFKNKIGVISLTRLNTRLFEPLRVSFIVKQSIQSMSLIIRDAFAPSAYI